MASRYKMGCVACWLRRIAETIVLCISVVLRQTLLTSFQLTAKHIFRGDSVYTMVRLAIVSNLSIGLAFGKQQLEPGQWHPAVETDGTPM
jgi:hypothetical protein